ncbi:hypothetical protein GBAR_LOCUS8437 [Geodia barretti]|uniref:Uncharacterized protein n=1 Tax=Geodia barretti TaxID=519541 RepID=A0AA35W9N6_GEOBA|nr:hypothetical protein GBAR_LOCUS8437 [Geodia barretti]
MVTEDTDFHGNHPRDHTHQTLGREVDSRPHPPSV